MAERRVRPGAEKKEPQQLVLSEEGISEPQFLDDLVAAIKLKTCLIGRGVDVDQGILDDLAKFTSQFNDDIKAFDVLDKGEGSDGTKPKPRGALARLFGRGKEEK